MIVSEKKAKVTNSRDVANFLRDSITSKLQEEDLHKEHFWMLTLNGRHVIQKTRLISVGCMTSAIVHPRECFRPAVIDSACAVIFGHNHPSGDPEPSEDDRKLTDRLVEAGQVLGIKVLDHVVIATGGFVSMMDGGRGE